MPPAARRSAGLPGPGPQAAAARTGNEGGTSSIPFASIPPAPETPPAPPSRYSAAAAAALASAANAAEALDEADAGPKGAAGQASQSDVITSKAVNLSRREAENIRQNGLCQPFAEYEPSKVNLESDFPFNALS